MEDNSTPVVQFKRCIKCQQNLPATTEYFHHAKISSDGLRGKCKQCRKPVQSAYKDSRQRLYQARIAVGVCPKCERDPLPGRTHCEKCTERNAQGMRRCYLRARAAGLCERCRIELQDTETRLCMSCRLIDRERQRDRHAAFIARGLCYQCGQRAFSGPGHLCEVCHKVSRHRHHKSHTKIRAAVYAAYGNQCACCSEQNGKFLTIDHVNGDGGQERKEKAGISGIGLMRQIIKFGYPKTYRLLCWNCNLATHIYGTCPHKEK